MSTSQGPRDPVGSQSDQHRSYTVREAAPGDERQILGLLSATLGWSDDPQHAELFRWKHQSNAFGASPAWVAEDDRGLVGFRTFMRWRFRVGEEVREAVRAVDTATHPRAQGRGVFRALTMHGVQRLTESGVACVFNTPNDRSAPGYLRMGWHEVGRLSVGVRPSGVAGLRLLAQARRPAELWSLPTTAGEDPAEVLRDGDGVEELLEACQRQDGKLRTARSAGYLKWRYAGGPIRYRALLAGKRLSDGLVVFRLRRRGGAKEVVVAEALTPPGTGGRKVLRSLPRSVGGDYALWVGSDRPAGWIPVAGRGPLLTWRPLADQRLPAGGDLDLSAGDIELF
jgi:GNAT superfamily N-acetyltransferase